MKLVILGGGGFRVPLVYDAVATHEVVMSDGSPFIEEVVLYDTSQHRLDGIQRVIQARAAQLDAPPSLRASTDLRDALAGADFVFSAIRVGGPEGRVQDERVALNLGLLGQETIGPGGLAYALRTIPVMMEVAEAIADVAPNAWTINFTNPAGIVTQAMRRVLGERVVGICDTPIGLVRRVSRLLGVSLEHDQSRVDYDYLGLNHLGFLRSVSVDGLDRLPEILADDARLEEIEEARLIGKDFVRALGALPNEYLYYYFHTDAAVGRIDATAQTRGQYLAEQQAQFYDNVAGSEDPLALWHQVLHEREATYMAEARDEERREEDMGGGYQEVALRMMGALATGRAERMILDVANLSDGRRVVPELPDDVVLEVGCVVDADGVHPLDVGPVSLVELGLMARLRAAEQAIAEAAITRDEDLAWKGFALHPLVDSPRLGRALLDGYIEVHDEIAALFRRSLSVT
ncbi:6-phospho-beta-glucosidase [Tessaracoccus massiliensis]|uniref:family 4 glycosyl hydrolase n=1 Tax=Tessaracoccus massiliensis TaxID=1522311 RepID=UPI00058E47F0|nr:6-phospho-beta-glucosidase [Tessaracoccus massiliensis]